jgi:hypothetical protein
MIGLWFLGDFGRLLYYVAKNQPYQFVLGGILTVVMDSIVLIQFLLYRGNELEDDRDSESSSEGEHHVDIDDVMDTEDMSTTRDSESTAVSL